MRGIVGPGAALWSAARTAALDVFLLFRQGRPKTKHPKRRCAPHSRGRAMAREPIPTWFFALVVVRKGDRFLLVQEHEHGQLWYLPAGRVEPGEGLCAAALRETLEESGVPVVLE